MLNLENFLFFDNLFFVKLAPYDTKFSRSPILGENHSSSFGWPELAFVYRNS